MKKFTIVFLIVGFAYVCARLAMAATTQPHSLGVVTAIIESKTLAQINAYSAKSAGQLVYCSDCTRSPLCVSSGTAAGAWTVAVATGAFAAGVQHCL